MIIRAISKFILQILGWKIETEMPEFDKCVIIGAPHTSNSDFFISMFYYLSKGMKISFLIKKEWFKFPFAGILHGLGGIPVARGQQNKLIDQMTELFTKQDKLYLMIAPEGTRKKVSRWKRGFHYIAKASNVPILLGYLDYKYKTVGVGMIFYASDDVDADMLKTKQFYAKINPRFPENFSTDLEEL